MLGRRQIREKVIGSLYSYYQNPISYDILEKNMFKEIDKIFNLYIYQLNFLVALKQLAENQMEIGSKKYFKSESDIHPNKKFIHNQILEQIENNSERIAFTEKHRDLVWDLHDDLLVKTFQKLVAGKRYKDNMASEEISFDDDQKFIGKLFLRYMAENDDFHNYIEDKELSWSDDIHITNSMIQKTIGFMKEGEPLHTLIKMIKDEDDRTFASKLLRKSLENWDDTEEKLRDRLVNWEINRISLMDRIILVTSITELDYFPLTPARVIMNEYIEIAKVFSTDKSNVFINGILDKYVRDKNINL